MFGFGSRKSLAVPDRTQVVGLDLTATRARAVALAAGRTRALLLDDPAEELMLFLNLDRRPAAVGRSGYACCRRLPHLVCSNFLPQLGHPQRWQGPRTTVTPESALEATFEACRRTVSVESDAVALALPGYLTAARVRAVRDAAGRVQLPVVGSLTTPLAVAVHRAGWVLDGPVAGSTKQAADPGSAETRPDWVVPIRPPQPGPGAVVVVDVDEYALTGTVVAVEPGEVQAVGASSWPRASLRIWKDRLLDAISDRCVRLCRRDPRDSADAEQSLYEQLDEALDQTRIGRPVRLTVRSSHWYQDLAHPADEFDAFCQALARLGADGVQDLVRSASLPAPPRAVWLTHTAARLPGLAAAIYQTSPEQTEVLALPPNAVADATAALVPLWLTGMLPRVHLDVAVPLAARAQLTGREMAARTAAPRG
jgi:hypothetical protein